MANGSFARSFIKLKAGNNFGNFITGIALYCNYLFVTRHVDKVLIFYRKNTLVYIR